MSFLGTEPMRKRGDMNHLFAAAMAIAAATSRPQAVMAGDHEWTTAVEASEDVKRERPRSSAISRRMGANTERGDAAPSFAPGGCNGPMPDNDVAFRFSVDGHTVDGTGTSAPDLQRCTDLALKQADIQIRYDGLNNEPRLNVVAEPDAALKGETVIFKTATNYALRIAHSEIRIFEAGDSVLQRPLAVVAVPGTSARWTLPKDLPGDLAPGAQGKTLRYVVRVYDVDGRFDETSAKVLDVADIRGGKLRTGDLMAVYDGNALATRNIPHSGGAILVSGRDIPAGSRVVALGLEVPVDAKGDFAVRQLVNSGPQQIEVEIIDRQGRKTTFSRSAVVPDSDFFYVALADLTAGHNQPNTQLALLNPDRADEFKDKTYVNGRLAFYLKGKIAGDTLLTAAADTRDQPIAHMFSNFDSKDPRYLLRNLDPNRYYPIYGDDSTLTEDAPTRGKFYVRLEKGDSSIVWGNFKTTVTGTEFIRYERGLYGARAQLKSDGQTRYGERTAQAEVFAAEPGTLGARDVFRGTGGSLFYMSRQNITQGSERVTVEVRDLNTGLVLKTRTLSPTQDYTVNYLQGRVSLNSPLSSVGENDFIVQTGSLSGGQQYLVVNYEYAPDLQASRDRVVGGRVSTWVNDHLEVGTTGYDQSASAERQRLYGADATLRYNPGTYIKVEGARSEGPGSGEQYSYDGGYTFNQRTTAGGVAYARRVEAAADLAEIIKGAEGRVSAYWKDKDRDFSGPGELAISGPVREMGLKSVVRIDEHWESKTKLDEKRDQYRTYSAGEQNVSYSFNDYWKATLGARLDNNNVSAQSASPLLNQNGRRSDVAVRVDYDSHRDWETYGFGQVTVERTGKRDNNNRIGVGGALRLSPTTKALAEISEGNGGLGGKVGVETKIDEKRSSYLNYAFDPDRTDIISRGGAGIFTSGARERFTDNLSVFGEERLRHGGGFSGLTHAFGLEYITAEHWKTGLAFETGELSDPLQGDVKRTSVSPTIGYTREGLTYSGRFEYRHDDTTSVAGSTAQRSVRDTYLTNNTIVNKLNTDWRYLGRLNASYSDATGGSFYNGNYVEAATGFAYRPAHDDRLNMLFKYTYFYDLPTPGQSVNGTQANDYSQASHVLSIDTAYDVNPWVTVGGKYALRIGQLKDNTTGGPWLDSQAQLLIGRVDLHIVSEWDVSGEVRWLDTTTAQSQQAGALLAVYRHVGENFKLGVGYNFTDYTDDLTNLSTHNHGVFLNAVGKF